MTGDEGNDRRNFPNDNMQGNRENPAQVNPQVREIETASNHACLRVIKEVQAVREKVKNFQEGARIVATMGKAAALEALKNQENLVLLTQQDRQALEKRCSDMLANAHLYNDYGLAFSVSYIQTMLAPDSWEQMIGARWYIWQSTRF